MYSDSDRVIALAGVFQAARLTRQLAGQADANREAMESSINSLFQGTPSSVPDVFGGIAGVEFGLHSMLNQLDSPQERDVDITRYAIGLLQLAKKLRADKERYTRLGKELDNLQTRVNAFNFESATRDAQLAGIYSEHISTMGPRIMVKGDARHLENTATASRIRSILLAGVRSGYLWYQIGGRRWHLLLYRKRIVTIGRKMLKQISEQREAHESV